MHKTMHKWTEQDVDLVRTHYDRTRRSVEYLAERIGCSFYGVKGKIAELGLSRDTRQFWTPEEEERLRELVGTYSVRRIAKMMGRGLNSVVLKVKRLGLHRRLRDGWFTKKEVCEILGVDHKWVQARIDCGALRAEWHDEARPSRAGLCRWHIKEEWLADFIRRYPAELHGGRRNIDIVMIVHLLSLPRKNGNGRSSNGHR